MNNVGASCRYRSCQLLSIKVKKRTINTILPNTIQPEIQIIIQKRLQNHKHNLEIQFSVLKMDISYIGIKFKRDKKGEFQNHSVCSYEEAETKTVFVLGCNHVFFSSSSSVTLNIILSILTSGIEFWSFSWTLRELLFLVLLQCAHN